MLPTTHFDILFISFLWPTMVVSHLNLCVLFWAEPPFGLRYVYRPIWLRNPWTGAKAESWQTRNFWSKTIPLSQFLEAMLPKKTSFQTVLSHFEIEHETWVAAEEEESRSWEWSLRPIKSQMCCLFLIKWRLDIKKEKLLFASFF